MEHPRPAGGFAESLFGAGVPAQCGRRQPAPHGSSGPSSEPAAGTPGSTSVYIQAQPATSQWYGYNTHISAGFTIDSACVCQPVWEK